ncbi:EamA family transporter [Virgibacillus dokdonensis]|uniref:EamA family transporter n=1 Tax=Virgibacillus dokdonensis TaxID=302167 RepID=A0A3E0WZI1_9BACI|nr:DMT family transporter [Virgibacillus dokdonensis]RFA37563.1 EamA family transporter [Virgibacillus dokdonensis]
MKKAYIFIILGATLWGTIGWYVNQLYDYGFSPMEVVILRAWTAAIMLVVYLLLFAKEQLRLRTVKDIQYFIGTGILSISFFNFCLFTTMELTTIPVATALLYTGPAFVVILSTFFLKETLNKEKIAALLFTFLGVSLVIEFFPSNMNTVSFQAVLFGLGAGCGYALYSIFSKFALRKYSTLSITTYTFVTAAIALTPFFPFVEKGMLLLQPNVILYAFGLGFLPTAFAYIIYTWGLKDIEASKASILTTVEPVVAMIIGIFIFKETFTLQQIIGMVIILGTILLIQHQPKKKTGFVKKAG